ncbi:mitochondrial import inner membrane translocase subunit tim16-like [Canna indica]|uniref:Mitochondrial import inner membrane translocase subunit tim16-like n=1 Tax=Canna indica TaxID=4628 RepID=A0AAQ3QMW2_9LILI|nr:mitochondrial import inner membrane translocase subunit tim16-like [Canna indica]
MRNTQPKLPIMDSTISLSLKTSTATLAASLPRSFHRRRSTLPVVAPCFGSSYPRRRSAASFTYALYSAGASRIIAQLLVAGSAIVGRAFVQAYRKALENANKTGVANETLQNIRRASKGMTEQEARKILGISEKSSWEDVMERYDVLFEKNGKSGSFYLQSKVHRAKECLEAVYQAKQ